MALYDKTNEQANVQVLAPVARTTTFTSSAIDLSTYDADAVIFLLSTGVITDGTFTPKLQECATSGGSYTDVAASDQVGTAFVACVAATNQAVGYIGSKQFLKLVITVGGSPATGAVIAANMIALGRRKQP